MLPYADFSTVIDTRRTRGYPAPLCEGCNVAMALNAEHRRGGQSIRREYQCLLCSAGTMIRRRNAAVPRPSFNRLAEDTPRTR